MGSIERGSGKEGNESIWKSRFFKVGGVVAVVGAGIGIGIITLLGLSGVAIGAGNHALRENKSK